MISNFKKVWHKNKFGCEMFIIGIILCLVTVILSFFWKIGISSFSDNTPYVVATFGIGITFVLTGLNIILQPPRLPTWYAGIYKKYIEANEILIIEFAVSIIFMILLLKSYPDGWHYPQLYILVIPYATCIILLTIGILFNIGEKENEITYIKRELDDTNSIIRAHNEMRSKMRNDNAAPEYVIEFAAMLKRNIDEIKSVMDELKMSIDDGTKNISERTVSMANKYKSDNEQLHNDVQKFKQRMEKERKEFKERANERIIKSLMKTLDRIDEILKYNMIKEIEVIKQDIYDTLKNEDVEIINPSIGDNFDDKKCCAVQIVETDKFPEKKIVDIKKVGFMFKSGKVIKYADVIVSKKLNIEKPQDKKGEDKNISVLTDEKIENTRSCDNDKIDKIRTREDMKAESQ